MRFVTILLAGALVLALPEHRVWAQTRDTGPVGAAAALAAKSLDLQSMLRYALEDERLARAEYGVVLERFGDVRPFSNIIRAEETHIGWLADLYLAHDMDLPEDATPRPRVPATLTAAMEAGRQAEIGNIAMYDRFLAQELPADVRSVFVQLKAASQNHLRAFSTGSGRAT